MPLAVERETDYSPWVVNPTRFSNQYFKLLLRDIWKPRKWDGPFQYEATVAGTKLMMLPTDVSPLETAQN